MSIRHYSEIIKNLYLGDAGFVYEIDVEIFDLIINCCPEISCSYKNRPLITILQLKFLDSEDENQRLIKILNETKALEQIHEYLQKGKKVMVHCAMGQQRSPTIIVCYLMKYYKMPLLQAMIRVKRKRPDSFGGGATFIEAIKHMSTNI